MSYRGNRKSNYATPPKRITNPGFPGAAKHPPISQKVKQDEKAVSAEPSEPSQVSEQTAETTE